LSFELKISDISDLSISFVYQVTLTDSFAVVTVIKLHKETYLSLDINFFHILILYIAFSLNFLFWRRINE